ncbi:MAG: hypothetical protein GYA15_01735 [Leptolinea sp.]|jgi:parvulin-like peptidyl-prolyl isomerase|nr:hypothetical protein [Leptolinea sp.]
MAEEESKKVITKKHLARLEKEQIQRRYLLTGVSIALFLVIALIVYGILDQFVFQNQRPVATVGTDKITVGQYQARVKYSRWELIQQYNRTLQMAELFGGLSSDNGSYFQNSLSQITSQLDNPTYMGENVLEAMIEERVIEQEAAKLWITITDEELNKAMEEAFGYYANGTPTAEPTYAFSFAPTSTLSRTQLAIVTITPTPTEAPTATEMPTATQAPTSTPLSVTPTSTVESTPLPTETPYTFEGYQKTSQEYLAKIKDTGMTEAELRYAIKSSLLRTKMTEKITSDVSHKEDQVWARHILLEDEQKAKDTLARIQKGEAWDILAKELSKDTSSSASGGDLGWFGKGKMVAEFSDAAFALKIGEISQPVKSSFGYHIIQVLGHEERELSAADYATKQQTTFNDWLEKSKTELGVKKNDISNITPKEPILESAAQ